MQIELGDGDAASRETNPDATMSVQFNPETLKVTYSNTMQGGDQSGGSAIQFVSKSSTKMSVELWFDAAALADEDDVRRLTKKVNHFITPVPQGEGMAPPAVRFSWGSILSRACSTRWTRPSSTSAPTADRSGPRCRSRSRARTSSSTTTPPSSGGGVPGTFPQRPQARQGDTLQGMVGRDQGRGAGAQGWQAVAAANGIENPRRRARTRLVRRSRRRPAQCRPGGRQDRSARMSVIINELEVVTDAEPPPSAPPNSPAPPRPAPGPTPFELRAVVRHLAHRADRVRAD